MAIAFGSSSFPAAVDGLGGEIGYGIGPDAGDQMIALFKQTVNNFARCIVGVRNKVKRRRDGQGFDQQQHFVEQGALVTIGPNQAFVNAYRQRYGEDTESCIDEQTDSL